MVDTQQMKQSMLLIICNMEKEMTKREKVWIEIAKAYTSSSNSTNKGAGVVWADYFADEFIRKFGE